VCVLLWRLLQGLTDDVRSTIQKIREEAK